jgi:hypothetical protein
MGTGVYDAPVEGNSDLGFPFFAGRGSTRDLNVIFLGMRVPEIEAVGLMIQLPTFNCVKWLVDSRF